MVTSIPHEHSGLQAALDAQRERWNVPGVAVGMLSNGKRETVASGVTSLETGNPVRPDTLFQIGSISKVFCATLVMTLVDEGLVNLDAPVSTYLPDITFQDDAAADGITLRRCLSHSSGLYGDYFGDFGWGDDALALSMPGFADLRQWFAPGSDWAYNNAGFNLAGRVVEVVTGQTFEAAMHARVFEPLGLTRTFYFAHEAIVYSVAVGHGLVTPGSAEHEVATSYPLPRSVNPAGGIISSVDDLLTFAEFHMGDGTINGRQVLTPESVRAMQEAQITAACWADEWGIGWDLKTVDGERMISHGGTTNGFQAQLHVVPARGFAIIIFTNSGRGHALNRNMGLWALRNVLGLEAADRPTHPLTTAELERFTGVYRQPQAEITVSIAPGGDTLLIDAVSYSPLADTRTASPTVEVTPIGPSEFFTDNGTGGGRRIDFQDQPGAARDAKAWRVRVGGRMSERDDSANATSA